MVATWIRNIMAYKFNTTIHDNDLSHVIYSDTSVKCNRWVRSWLLWKTCDSWAKPWTSGVYHSQGEKVTFHSSLNHRLASVTIKFEGTDVWVYGPPASQLAQPPPDYEICLYESYHTAPKSQCYRTNTTEAYSASEDKEEPVVVFARGQLLDDQHQIVISVANPVDGDQEFNGIRFSHVVYTNERPTPWPVEEDHWRYREVVMHDTHPLLSYSPTTLLGSAKVHTVDDGSTISWHEIKSHSEGGVETKIRAGAVAIYGAPSAYIETRESLGSVCIRLDRGRCETVNLKTVYANQREFIQNESEPVLLWRNDRLDPSHETRVSIQLVNASSGATTTFPFKSINYREAQEYSSPQPLTGPLWNVTVNHDDRAISYNPQRRCVHKSWTGWCETWLDRWEKNEVGPSGSVLTYRSTLSKYRTEDDPHITLSFRGSAVYLYGAPAAYAGRPFAPQHVCINDMCRVIDIEQAYLHPPGSAVEDISAPLSSPHPELEPVLIWAITGLDGQLEHTLRLALAPLPSQDDAVMTIVKVVYTQADVRHDEHQDPPAPKPDHAYAGPLHPPYATALAPLDHKPLPTISTDTLLGWPPFLLLFAFFIFVVYRCLPRALKFWRDKTRGAGPLLPSYPLSFWPSRSQIDPDSPPRYSNITDLDTLPHYSPAATSDANRQR
ncbi:transmembrane protein, putative [Rhizoctonia solani AG-3 Rhs1AP]|uniref:Transmembrane protein, putative n=2 Tax=Rhizoctonia solani AG-3 TaxID=1086053 RepID=A0A0A1UM58_9AGAM|nr:transmembrane protein, putative [Rhizoctonia solani AG-3 Rhs1AP]KEP52859.1 putative transmembrane protein [Rhizoctonia solani 123E]